MRSRMTANKNADANTGLSKGVVGDEPRLLIHSHVKHTLSKFKLALPCDDHFYLSYSYVTIPYRTCMICLSTTWLLFCSLLTWISRLYAWHEAIEDFARGLILSFMNLFLTLCKTIHVSHVLLSTPDSDPTSKCVVLAYATVFFTELAPLAAASCVQHI